MIKTRHYIRVDFTYPPISPPYYSAWDDIVDRAVFDLKHEVEGITEIDIFTGDDISMSFIEAETERLHTAYSFQAQLWELLEAYGCTVDKEET